jgi:TetR/AcrR family transcriptional regulator
MPTAPTSPPPYGTPADTQPCDDTVAASKRERRKDARPGELLAAALDLFVEKGFAATRAEEVAQRAGVSKGTLFLYFASKEELFKAVVRGNIPSRFPEWQQAQQAFTGSTADLLHLFVQGWWTSIGATTASGISKLMMAEGAHFPDLADFYRQEVLEPVQNIIASIVLRGIERQEFRPLDVNFAVCSILGAMLFLVNWKHAQGTAMASSLPFRPKEFLTEQVNTLLYGWCTASPAPTSTPPHPLPVI